MAWSNIGPIFELMPGQSVVWTYSWDNGQDMGLQLAGANYPNSIINPGTLATLVTSNQSRTLLGFSGPGAMISYQVTITNTSSEIGAHNLLGGGVS
jgi:hypothetical protein